METRYQRAIDKAIRSITDEQRLKIISMLNTHKRKDIAKEIGISETKLRRIAKGSGYEFTFAKARPFGKYSKELTEEVISFFEEHGISETKKKYPDVRVRSIIERYPRKKPRQRNWKDEEIIQAIKFGPFVSNENQYKFFKRPGAYQGSIKALWAKKIKGTKLRTHGLPFYIASKIIDGKKAVLHKTAFKNPKHICTWQTLKENLKDDCPAVFKVAIEAGYEFHVWLYGENPNEEISRMYKEFSKETQDA